MLETFAVSSAFLQKNPLWQLAREVILERNPRIVGGKREKKMNHFKDMKIEIIYPK